MEKYPESNSTQVTPEDYLKILEKAFDEKNCYAIPNEESTAIINPETRQVTYVRKDPDGTITIQNFHLPRFVDENGEEIEIEADEDEYI